MAGRTPAGQPAGGSGPAPAVGIGVFTTDTKLTVRTWDEWLARVTGIGPDAARGRLLQDLVPDLESRGLVAPFEHVLAGGAMEILAPAFHGYLIACPPSVPSDRFDCMQQRVTVAPLREDGLVVGTIVAVEDVTHRLDQERDLTAQLAHLDPDVRLRAATLLAQSESTGDTDPLLAAIGDENWRVRRTAVSALGRRNRSQVIAAVLQALRDDHRNFSVLSSAVELLAAADVDVLEPLLELLHAPDADLRLQAALVLGERGDSRAVPALLATLTEPDENLRFHAIEALGKLRAAAAVEPLAAMAASGEFFLAFPALEALARIGDPTVAPRLVPLLKDGLLRAAAAAVLGQLGDEDVVAPLTGLLNDATAPTEVIADAIAGVFDRYEQRYGDGEPVADLVRHSIRPTGTQNLLDAVQRAGADRLRSIAKVLSWLEGPAVERALTLLLGQPSVRGKAVEYLVRHGGRVVELLMEQIGAEDLDTRHAAVVGLGRIGDRRATGALVELLGRDPALMVATAGALARIGDGLAFEALFGLLGHHDAAVRQAVIAALNSIGHPGMASRVMPLLRESSPPLKESAVRIAGYFGYPECADDLLSACHDPDADVRRAALEHLCFLDDDRVFDVLRDALDDRDSKMRAAAIQALGRLDDPRAAGPLLAALRDDDAWVRYFAARALGERRHTGAVDDLTRAALDDGAGQVRLAAVAALGSIGSASAVPALAALSASEDPERACAAIRAIGGISGPDAWAPLRTALRAGDDLRRAAAAEAVARLDGAGAVELLEWTAGADASDAVVAAAVDGLRLVATDRERGATAVSALVRLAADASRREMVVAALAGLPPALIDTLAQGLRDPRPAVRSAVVQALGRMRHADASRRLQSALDDDSPDVRVAALTELRHLGTRGIERRVLALTRTDPEPVVRRAALAVLHAAGSTAAGSREGDLTNVRGGAER